MVWIIHMIAPMWFSHEAYFEKVSHLKIFIYTHMHTYIPPYSQGIQISHSPSILPCDMFQGNAGTPWAIVPGMYGTHCKHNLLIPSSIFNNTRLIHKWMYVCWNARTHTKIYESNEK